jgi:hypothetical protein
VSGLTNTAQQAGAALGLAVLAVVAARVSDAGLDAGLAEVAALRDGYSRAYLTAAGFSLGALIITALVLRNPPGARPAAAADGEAATAEGEAATADGEMVAAVTAEAAR